MSSQDPTIVLSLTVGDVAAALDFYGKAFGAKELARMAMPDGTVMHAEFMIGNTMLYISTESAEWKAYPLAAGALAPCLFGIGVENTDAALAQAVAAGASIIEAPKTQFWGMRTSILSDPFGYRWNVRQLIEE